MADGEPKATKLLVNEHAATSKSTYFATSLRLNRAHKRKDIILEDHNGQAMRLWLHYIHPAPKNFPDARCLPEIDIKTIWLVIVAADKYGFDGKLAEDMQNCFSKWYDAKVDFTKTEDKFARQLALPCYFLNHARGFARTNEWLVYNHAGHITEDRPVRFRWKHMHLAPPDFVGTGICNS